MDESYLYTDAFAELQEIVAEIEQGEISIDELSEKVKRASILIAACKAKLTATEADVNAILETLKQTDTAEEEEETAEAAGSEISEEPEATSADEDTQQEEE